MASDTSIEKPSNPRVEMHQTAKPRAVFSVFVFIACCLGPLFALSEERMTSSKIDAGPGSAYAEQIIGEDVDAVSAPAGAAKFRKSDVRETLGFPHMFAEFTRVYPEGSVKYLIIAAVEDGRIADAEAYATFNGDEFARFNKPLHWAYFDNRKEYAKAFLGVADVPGISRSDAEALLVQSGLIWHRETIMDGKIIIQYFRPLFKKSSLLDRAGANMSPNIPWLAELVLEGDTVISFATKPTGWGDEALLLRQAREHYESGE